MYKGLSEEQRRKATVLKTRFTMGRPTYRGKKGKEGVTVEKDSPEGIIGAVCFGFGFLQDE